MTLRAPVSAAGAAAHPTRLDADYWLAGTDRAVMDAAAGIDPEHGDDAMAVRFTDDEETT